ncbi:MAG: radical SAM protein [Vicinamibacteria bacterium]
MTRRIDRLRGRVAHKRNRLVQELGVRLGKELGKPNEIYLKITHRCRTQCVMCNIWATPNRPSEELDTGQWNEVLDDLRSWLGPYEVWFIGGEPFVRRDLYDILEHAAKIGLYGKVVTRGVGVLKEEHARRLVDSGLAEYHVSVEALDPAIHDYVSPPPGSHEKAIKGIEMIDRVRHETGSPLKIVVKTIIMGVNAHELVELVEWVEDNGLDLIKFQPIEQTLETPRAGEWYTESPLWPQGEEALATVLDAIDGLIAAKRRGAPIDNTEFALANMRRYFVNPGSMYEPVITHRLNTVGRKASKSHLEVWHDGDAKIVWDRPSLGNVLETSFKELWKRRDSVSVNERHVTV